MATEKITKAQKQAWVDALRSGEYKQVAGTLGSGGGHCCLGVACVVWGISFTPGSNGQAYMVLEDILGDIFPFTSMNDLYGKSFAEIADYIEEHVYAV